MYRYILLNVSYVFCLYPASKGILNLTHLSTLYFTTKSYIIINLMLTF